MTPFTYDWDGRLLVLIADTHGRYPELPPCDVVIHAGDLTRFGSALEVRRAGEWLQSLDCRLVLFTRGNHDQLMERDPALARRLLGPKTLMLVDQPYLEPGLRVWGAPWVPAFFPGHAFSLKTEAERTRHWALVPPDTNLLLTHCPPLGTLDADDAGDHLGCSALARRTRELAALRLHVFGHIHASRGQSEEGGVKYVNAGMV